MSWSDLKNDPHFVRAVKIGTAIGIFVTLGGVVREAWFVFQVVETRSRAASDAILQGLETRMLYWAAMGILVTFIFIIVVALLLSTRDEKKSADRGQQ